MVNKHNWANDNAGYLMGDPKDNHPERFPNNPEMDAISRLMSKRDELQATADRRLKLLEAVAIWYEADEFEYMPPRLWKRIKKELKELSDA